METMLVAGVLIFLAIMALVGYSKGFIKVVLSLAVTVVSIVISVLIAPMCEEFIKERTPVYNMIKEEMTEFVTDALGKGVDAATVQLQEEAIKKLSLPEVIEEQLVKNTTIKDQTEQQVVSFGESIAISLTDILLNAVTIFILFSVVKIILKILINVLDVITRLPVLHGVNKLLGAGIGVLEGVLVLWVICIAITMIGGTDIGIDMLEAIAVNPILSFIYNNNLLVKFVL